VIGIADTGFLVAFKNGRDAHHVWAQSVARDVTEPLSTCESVLSETTFHLGDPTAVFEMIESGFIRLAFDANRHVAELSLLARQFADQQPDFADLCLDRMSELFPQHPIVTTDRRDFTVYRRNQRELIPLILPPE